MEVLNAASSSAARTLTPLPLPNNSSNKPNPKTLKNQLIARSPLAGGLASLLAGGPLARALTYDEALKQSLSLPEALDLNRLLDLASDNALLIGGAAAAIAAAAALSAALGRGRAESAREAYRRLAEDAGAALVDIRESRAAGGPDLRGIKRRAVAVAYDGKDKDGFLRKLAARFKDPGNTTLFILDKYDGNSKLVAELVTANGFKAAYAIIDGAEGARGWLKSGLPWSSPKKILALDFDDLKESISSTFGGDSDALPVLGLAAATGIGLFTFTELDTVLQLLGSAAILQFVTKKLLYAEDRKKTLQQIDEFLNTKIAPKELVDEIKTIGKALLPEASSAKSPPSPAEEPSAPASPTQPPPVVNSVSQAEVGEGAVTGFSRPLSPYPYYPDFKPPSSPSPSKP